MATELAEDVEALEVVVARRVLVLAEVAEFEGTVLADDVLEVEVEVEVVVAGWVLAFADSEGSGSLSGSSTSILG